MAVSEAEIERIVERLLPRVLASRATALFPPRSLPVTALRTGSAGQVVSTSNGLAAWAAASGGGGTAATTSFTPAAGIAATNVQAAIEEDAGDLAVHAALTTGAHGGIVASTDPRLTDARTPTAHAASHRLGGADALKIHELALPTAATPMNGQILTGLGAGTAAGHSLRYEQLFTTGSLSLLGGLRIPATFTQIIGTAAGVNDLLLLDSAALYLYKNGDPSYRTIVGQSQIQFGSGAAAADWSMSRTAANEVTLAAGDSFRDLSLVGVPTAPTAVEGTNTLQLATTAFVQAATGSASSNRPVGRMALTAAQSPATATWTAISFNTELTDTDGMVTIASTPTRLTCVTAGEFDVFAHVSFTANSTGLRGIRLVHKNSAGTVQALYHPDMRTAVASPAVTDISTSATFPMVAGDYVEAEMYQSSGAALATVVGAATHHATLSASWTGGTGAAWGSAAASASFTADTSHATSNSLLLVTWTAEDFDTDGMYSTASTPSRMYVNTPGTYQINANVAFGANGTGGRYAQIRKNAAGVNTGGTLVDYTTDTDVNASFFNECRMSKTVQLVAGDYLEVFAFQNSGAALNMLGGAGRSFLSMVRVGYQTNPSKDGQQVTGGRSVNDTSSVSSAAGAATTWDTGRTITVTGDGVNGMMIEAWGNLDTPGDGGPRIRDGAGVVLQDGYCAFPGAYNRSSFCLRYYQAPFTGSKTFKLSVYNAEVGTYTVFGVSGHQHGIRATWTPA